MIIHLRWINHLYECMMKKLGQEMISPMYRLEECMDLVQDCTLEELVALSMQVREDWKGYRYSERKQLLAVMVIRRKQLCRDMEAEILYSLWWVKNASVA